MAMVELRDPEGAVAWLRAAGARSLATDSRRVRAGDAFLAWRGARDDGRAHVAAALAAGAACCLVDADGADAFAFDERRVARASALKTIAGSIADAWYARPSMRLEVVAVTGTNGKTSVAWWTAQALSALGRRCGVIGTLGVGEPPLAGAAAGDRAALRDTGLTTPDAVMLQAALADFAAQGFDACAMEASSIGLVDPRLVGTRITMAQFTNFTQDHLDYHGDMPAYWAAKRTLFGWPGLRAAVINVDDEQGAALATELAAAGSPPSLWTYSLHGDATVLARDLRYEGDGLAFDLVEGDRVQPVRCRLVGRYNASNLLAVVGALRALGVDLAAAAQVLPKLSPVPGRMQQVSLPDARTPLVVVDYAHTPDALEQALLALQPLARTRAGALWCVFGCGGNRDATKRPLMGAIARRCAQHVVLTSDNPRHEAPSLILAQILAGIPDSDGVDVIEDRAAAIHEAVERAQPSDVVLIAGKGHEQTQEVAGVKRAFSDVAVAMQALQLRGGAMGAVA
ncbi:MAG TPA: UDP-N-acetylmuramoyl-L-alanyl-D-glutamate--2,6-diaminopimelate ligase [Burkholderiaceae bacterium]|nr:UDP-N-acetylmuramoyl-L-alanyl-D-glutamate--2,6-diaminopimelate ligase [Burkholderiaceae bacterium]